LAGASSHSRAGTENHCREVRTGPPTGDYAPCAPADAVSDETWEFVNPYRTVLSLDADRRRDDSPAVPEVLDAVRRSAPARALAPGSSRPVGSDSAPARRG
jgi:hypothetical protein